MDDKAKKEASTEVESDPMKGVKEVKGDDKPKEPEVVIDVAKHQDAADPDAANGDAKHGDKEEIKADAAAALVSAPAPTETPKSESLATEPEKSSSEGLKKKHKLRNIVLIGLLILCFLCLACCASGYFLRDQLVQYISVNTTATPDDSLTTVNENQIAKKDENLEELVARKKETATVTNGKYMVTLTEKEFLTAALNDAEDVDPSAFALKFETGMAKVQIDVSKLMASTDLENSEELKNIPVDANALKGVIITAEITTTEDGSKLVISKLSTGNPILDALIPKDALNSLQDQFDLSSFFNESGSANLDIRRIEFMDGKVRLTIAE